jgi:hypothetical protein
MNSSRIGESIRWLDRIQSWWPVVLSSGAVRGALSEWTGSVSRVLDAIRRCAASHIGLPHQFTFLTKNKTFRKKAQNQAYKGRPKVGVRESMRSLQG